MRNNSFFSAHKKEIRFSTLYFIISVLLLTAVNRDAGFYKDTVARIVLEQTSEYGTDSAMFEQNMTAVIENGADKGRQVKLVNRYSSSLTVDEKYNRDDQVFVSMDEGEETGKITGLKRDGYVAGVLLILIYLLLLSTGKRGVAAIVSVLFNIALLYAALCCFAQGTHILLITILLMVAFTLLSLLCAAGIKKVTLTAICATLVTVAATGLIYLFALKLFGEPEYFMMEYTEYLTNAGSFGLLFFAEVLVGGLGAVMDVAISIATTADELIYHNPAITLESLYDGVKHVAGDIMGTMINVLFLSYFCGTIPLILVKLMNHYGFTEIFKFHIPFEVIRFLTGSIGILLSIPVSCGMSIFILKKRGKEL